MQIKVTPEQIQALNNCETITVLVRMEPQPVQANAAGAWRLEIQEPYPMATEWRKDRSLLEQFPGAVAYYCPVAVGDTVEVIESVVPRYSYPQKRSGGVVFENMAEVFVAPVLCTVRHIAHREQDDGHYWALEVGSAA